jgi:hypothetical protein
MTQGQHNKLDLTGIKEENRRRIHSNKLVNTNLPHNNLHIGDSLQAPRQESSDEHDHERSDEQSDFGGAKLFGLVIMIIGGRLRRV